MNPFRWLLAAAALAALPTISAAQGWHLGATTTQLASDTPNERTRVVAISADGGIVLFRSIATDLAPGFDKRGMLDDAFVYVRETGDVELISHVAGRPQEATTMGAVPAAMTPDGRWIAFHSSSARIRDASAPERWQDGQQVYLYDRQTRQARLVSHAPGDPMAPGDGASTAVALTPDGRFLLYYSSAGNLGSHWMPQYSDQTYVFDRESGTTTLVSRSAYEENAAVVGDAYGIAISDDGQRVLYGTRSKSPIRDMIYDNQYTWQLFMYEPTSARTTLVSRYSEFDNVAVFGDASTADFTPDLRFIAYGTAGSRSSLAATDTNGVMDAWLYDVDTATTELLSHAADQPAVTANGAVYDVVMSADASRIAISTRATDMVAGVQDTNGTAVDAYLIDRAAGTRRLLSHRSDSPTTTGNGYTDVWPMSRDGSRILLASKASDLVDGVTDTNQAQDFFVVELASGDAQLVSHRVDAPLQTPDLGAYNARFAADGSRIAFESDGTNMVPGRIDANGAADLFLHHVADGSVRGISAVAPTAEPGPHTPNQGSLAQAISDDGRFVLSLSWATNVVPGYLHRFYQYINNDYGELQNLVMLDRVSGTRWLVNRSARGPTTSVTYPDLQYAPIDMSADGRTVMFSDWDDDYLGVSITLAQTYAWDRDTQQLRLVSHVAGQPGVPAGGESLGAGVSSDGRWVAFVSKAPDLAPGLPPGTARRRAWLRDLQTQELLQVSGAQDDPVRDPNESSSIAGLSTDGRWVVMTTRASNLFAPATTPYASSQVLLWDRSSRAHRLISRSHADPAIPGNGSSTAIAVSDDGRWLLLSSQARDLMPALTGPTGPHLYLFDRDTGSIRLVSHAAVSATQTSGAAPTIAALSRDGSRVAFRSTATDLVAGVTDTAATNDLFLWSRDGDATVLVSRSAADPLRAAESPSTDDVFRLALSMDGSRVAWTSRSTDIVAGVPNTLNIADLFLFDLATGRNVLLSRSRDDASVAVGITSYEPVVALTPSGEHVLFDSYAQNLTMDATDRNADPDVVIATRRDPLMLRYAAPLHGTLSGATDQLVDFGGDGTPVRATADAGFHFERWSDGSSENPRRDRNVLEAVDVQAEFEIGDERVFGNGFE